MKILLISGLILFSTGFAYPATLHVPANYATIQDAINNANNRDTVLVAPGVYYENINFLGKAITVTSSGGVGATTIDGAGSGSVVTFDQQETPNSVISGFTIKNGSGTYVSGLFNDECGGGVFCANGACPTILDNHIIDNDTEYGGGVFCHQSAAPHIINNHIMDNWAVYGGGIYSRDASPSIHDNLIQSNRADDSGAGINCYLGAVVIEDNLINYNIALGEFSSSGGGVSAGGSQVVIRNNTFTNNLADSGGGLSCGWQATVTQNNIYNNKAYLKGAGIDVYMGAVVSNNLVYSNKIIWGDGSGGGICVWGNATITGNSVYKNLGGHFGGGIKVEDNSNAMVDSNRVYENFADAGAGICCDLFSSPIIRNNVIYKNHALNDGGGLLCRDGCSMVAVNNTIVKNSAGWFGGGITCVDCNPKVINSIVRYNIAPKSKDIKGTADVSFSNVEAGWTGPGNIDLDPHFADAQDHDYHLLYTSPCRDSGDGNSPHLPPFDFENDPRISGNAVDMGADEFHDHIYVTGILQSNQNIEVKVLGLPSTWPVGFWVGFDLYANPIPCQWGEWFLKFPVLGPVVLLPIPSNGMVTMPATIPPNSMELTFYLHALIGNSLSNVYKVEILN